MTEREQINTYLTTLSRYLSRLDKGQADEVLREIESHIFDVIEATEQRGQVVDADQILQGFGSPRSLAQSYVEHVTQGTPPPEGFAAIGPVRRNVTKTLYYGMAVFGFSIAAALILTGFANLIVPDSVGVWSAAGGDSIVVGMVSDKVPPGDELTGFWYTPLAVILGYLLLRLTVSVMQVLKRQLA
ncbi:hypothetical protein LJ739_11365 [Aestuariibacter halophilus]|uniref:DUF1700 domain-containing protein n=1 Tax=Fluctibacter halophilus TaxID=226011 RepID=A0ABS8G9I0_9ALTE|nr:hypothetical protein [Aestuariibacter halophilus]MCC2616841.1 hypothetical protein [Aestuariibacter halophilus]